jgi:hypothetical protein
VHASGELLTEAVKALGSWRDSVQQQTSSHLYSFLAPKWRGAQPGAPLNYSEADDRDFWDAFFRVRSGDWPYFDPIKNEWRPSTQWHSNTATQRKNRFVNRWGAATWEDDVLTLAPNYAEIFVGRVLTKARKVTRIPALPLAVWLYKLEELPPTAPELVERFKQDFNFGDAEFTSLFNAAT